MLALVNLPLSLLLDRNHPFSLWFKALEDDLIANAGLISSLECQERSFRQSRVASTHSSWSREPTMF